MIIFIFWPTFTIFNSFDRFKKIIDIPNTEEQIQLSYDISSLFSGMQYEYDLIYLQ